MAASNYELDVQETEKKIEQASRLDPNVMQKIMALCTNMEVSSHQVNHILMMLVRKFSEQLAINALAEIMQSELEMADRLGQKLRKDAKMNKALRYYYYGVYSEKMNQIQQDFTKQRSVGLQQAVVSRKNFKPIMCCVYKKGMIQQSELAKQLNIERGNLSREMTHLVKAGFIEQRKAGKYKLYNLSSMGENYFKQYLVICLPGMQAKDEAEDDIVWYYDKPYDRSHGASVAYSFKYPNISNKKRSCLMASSSPADEEVFTYE